MKKLSSIMNRKQCYGCGTCAGICPANAIKMELKSSGIYLPTIERSKCNNCSLCTKSCPWEFDRNFFEEPNNELLSDISLGNYRRCKSSSGGLLSSLLIYLLEKGIIDGAVVTKMDEINPLLPIPFIARNKEDIISAIGSKYIPVPVNTSLKEILKHEGRYAIVGLPCHIQGIIKAESINKVLKERIVFHLGIMCSGTIKMDGTKLLLKALQIDTKDLSKIYYRGNGWPGGFHASLINGDQTKLISYSDYFSIIRFYLSLPCFLCWDSMNELSDISFGDAWLDSVKNLDNKGTSLLISRSKKGEKLLKTTVNRNIIKLIEISSGEVIKSQQVNIDFKKRNLNMRLFLMQIFNNDIPDFKNVGQFNEINYTSIFRTLLLFVRCLLMSNTITHNSIEPVLVHILKSKAKK